MINFFEQFEDFLLSCGAAHLRDKHRVADFKVQMLFYYESKRNVEVGTMFESNKTIYIYVILFLAD